jgi:flagellar hook-associated protein 2
MSISPLTFTGVSQFSSDLQAVMERAVKIAALPLQAMQNRDADVLQKKGLLGGLSAAVAGFGDSLKALGETSGRKALAASSSKPAIVSVLNSGATAASTYTINSVTSIAAAASERSLLSYADSAATPVGTTGDFKLVVGDDNYTFSASNNTLVGLRDKINDLGAGVTASILTTTDGNYLSISATASGETTLELYDDPSGVNANILTGTNQGTDLVFHLNGIQITQNQNLVNSVVPGLTFTVLDETDTSLQLQLSTKRSDLSASLSTFVSNFNSIRDALTGQTGPSAGLLSGNSLVHQLSGMLRNVSSYRTTSGSVKGLADLGVHFNNAGKVEFDSAKFNALSETQISDAFTFLGTATSGLGGLSRGFKQFTDPINGLIKLEQQGLDRVDQALQKQMAALTDRIELMQRGLALRLQKADALLASLDSQQNTVKASLQGLGLVLYGKQS